jgi:RNA polymerase sigma factor (sigma-70 family)
MPTDTSITQPTLLSAIRNNDEKALKVLYQNNYHKVKRYVLENTGTASDAKDIFQEAFIVMWRNIQLDRFQPAQESSLDAYLFTIARNKWLDHLRQAKRMQTVSIAIESNGIENIQELTEEESRSLKEIKESLKMLGDLCREVLKRFYYQKQSMKTIAEEMNWTEATARNNKYRCLQQLRKYVNAKNPDHE